jgi:hypothetical protein
VKENHAESGEAAVCPRYRGGAEIGPAAAAVEAIRCQGARATLDGQAISSGKSKIHLGLEPHVLAESAGDKQQEYRFLS